jgi:hypothetical protein
MSNCDVAGLHGANVHRAGGVARAVGVGEDFKTAPHPDDQLAEVAIQQRGANRTRGSFDKVRRHLVASGAGRTVKVASRAESPVEPVGSPDVIGLGRLQLLEGRDDFGVCLLYTSDAADD